MQQFDLDADHGIVRSVSGSAFVDEKKGDQASLLFQWRVVCVTVVTLRNRKRKIWHKFKKGKSQAVVSG
jgi:hypothetical protein